MTEPQRVERAVGPSANPTIWGASPQLPHKPGRDQCDYKGRVFVEVWGRDSRKVVVGGGAELEGRALAALDAGQNPVPATRVPWTNAPATGGVPGQAFLGRAVIEVWSDDAVVAVTGPAVGVIERARQRLREG